MRSGAGSAPTEQDELSRTGKVSRVIQERLFQGEFHGNIEGRSGDREGK